MKAPDGVSREQSRGAQTPPSPCRPRCFWCNTFFYSLCKILSLESRKMGWHKQLNQWSELIWPILSKIKQCMLPNCFAGTSASLVLGPRAAAAADCTELAHQDSWTGQVVQLWSNLSKLVSPRAYNLMSKIMCPSSCTWSYLLDYTRQSWRCQLLKEDPKTNKQADDNFRKILWDINTPD